MQGAKKVLVGSGELSMANITRAPREFSTMTSTGRYDPILLTALGRADALALALNYGVFPSN